MQISISLVALTGSFETDMARASKTAQKRMNEIKKNFEEVGKAIGLALVAGATALSVGIKNAIDSADELSKTAQKIGITTEALSRLSYAAGLADVELDQLQGGLAKMTKFQAEAAAGGKEQAKVFEDLGIAIKDTQGHLRDTESVLKDFANVFAALPDGPEKTALALKVFGRSGAEMIPLLNQGARGLREAGDELERFGGVLSTQAGQQAEEFNDNLRRLHVEVNSLFLAVARDLLPDLVELAHEFVDTGAAGDKTASTAHQVAEDIRLVGASCMAAVDGVQALTSGLIGITESFAKIMQLNPGVLLARLASGGRFNGGLGGNASDAFAQAGDEVAQMQGRFAPGSANSRPAGFGRGIRGGGGRGFSSASPNGTAPDLSGLFSEGSKAAKAHKADVDQVQQAYERMNAQMAETIALFGNTSEVEKVRYDIEHGELAKLSAEKKQELLDQAASIDRLNDEAEAKEKLKRVEDERADTIKRAHEDLQATLSDMQFELDLIGKSNAERTAEIELRRIGVGLSDEEREAAKEQLVAMETHLEALQKQQASMDEFRGTMADFIATTDFSADSFKDFADTVIQQLKRIAAEWLTTKLFGAQGTGGPDWLSSIFGALSGTSSTPNNFGIPGLTGLLPGFASGTPSAPGGWAVVGENGPELVNLPRGSQVVPNHEMASVGGFTQINNFPVLQRTDNRTAMQQAQANDRLGRMAARRNGG